MTGYNIGDKFCSWCQNPIPNTVTSPGPVCKCEGTSKAEKYAITVKLWHDGAYKAGLEQDRTRNGVKFPPLFRIFGEGKTAAEAVKEAAKNLERM